MTGAPVSRAALYWTPGRDDPLWEAGNSWLGRDPEMGVAVAQPAVAGLADITATPRAYGFHATLRPPMRLATGWEEFIAAADTLASRCADFEMPRLQVSDLGGFLALCVADPSIALHDLADICVIETDRHRLRADAAELARRRGRGLAPEQDALLLRWGYPYVMQHWQFHMTLSRRLDDAEMARVRPAAMRHFEQALSHSRRARDIAVFTQAASPGAASAPFLIAERLLLRG